MAAGDFARLLRGLALSPLEDRLISRHRDASLPIVFIVGAPRSGSTLLEQVGARCFDTAYVSNFVARYWLTPVVGWRRFLRHRSLDRATIALSSRLGATEGELSPHEFGYFWRTWLELGRSDRMSERELERCDWERVRAELEALSGWFRAPLVLKNLNATSYQIGALARLLPQARFLHVVRDRERTIGSILAARRAAGGGDRFWWSVRPDDWREAAGWSPRAQAEHQVDDVRAAVEVALSELAADRRLTLELEGFTADPAAGLRRIAPLFGLEPRLERLPEGEVVAGR